MNYTYSIFCLFIQWIVSVYDEPHPVLGPEITVMNETTKNPLSPQAANILDIYFT